MGWWLNMQKQIFWYAGNILYLGRKEAFMGICICCHSLNDSFKTCVLCLCMNCTSISKNTKYTNINSMEDRKVLKFDIGNTDVFL